MKVRAKETGFYNSRRYREGQEFSIPDDAKLAKWMELASAPKAEKVVEDDEPTTFSEIARATSGKKKAKDSDEVK